jgi:hypothetical protein
MTQRSSGDFAAGWNIADEFDAIRIRGFGGIQFLIGAFHAVDNRRKRHMPVQRGAAIGVDAADRGAHLIVSVSLNIFHQEID